MHARQLAQLAGQQALPAGQGGRGYLPGSISEARGHWPAFWDLAVSSSPSRYWQS
jgi:hypothetical protein